MQYVRVDVKCTYVHITYISMYDIRTYIHTYKVIVDVHMTCIRGLQSTSVKH